MEGPAITVKKGQWYYVCCHCDYSQADADYTFPVTNVAETELALLLKLREESLDDLGEDTYDTCEIDVLIERIGKTMVVTYKLLKPIPGAEVGDIFYPSEDERYYAIGKNGANSTVNTSFAASYPEYFELSIEYV